MLFSNKTSDERRLEGCLIDQAVNHFHVPYLYPMSHLTTNELEDKFEMYKEDERNENVLKESIQKNVVVRIGKNKYLGRIDQVRKGIIVHTAYEVWDIKWSEKGAKPLLECSLPALIMYASALGCKVGGVINVKNYGTSNPVFVEVEDFDVRLAMKNINDSLIYRLYRGEIICIPTHQ